MHLFHITPEAGPELPVFAESYDHASQIFMVWWMLRHSGEMPPYMVQQRNPQWPGLDVERLREALSWDFAGIGHFDPSTGWKIVSPAQTEEHD